MALDRSLGKAFRRAATFLPAARWRVELKDGPIDLDSLCAASFDPPVVLLTLPKSASDKLGPEFTVSGTGVTLTCSPVDRKEPGDRTVLFAAVLRVEIRGGAEKVRWRGAWFDLQLRYPFLDSVQTLEAFVNDWRTGVLHKEQWTHAAHVGVTGYYAFDREDDAVYAEMKRGILYFNSYTGGVNGPDSGYHETLTRFWSNRITVSVREGRHQSRLDSAAHAVRLFGEDRDLPGLFYSVDVVRDRRARREWVQPDLEPRPEWCGEWARP